jgi:hypothetical protein
MITTVGTRLSEEAWLGSAVTGCIGAWKHNVMGSSSSQFER